MEGEDRARLWEEITRFLFDEFSLPFVREYYAARAQFVQEHIYRWVVEGTQSAKGDCVIRVGSEVVRVRMHDTKVGERQTRAGKRDPWQARARSDVGDSARVGEMWPGAEAV